MSSRKLSNPKDAIGITKLDLGLVPDSAVAALAVAFTEGAVKYGRYNWRVAGVRASVYHAALRRHVAKWWNGQDHDSKTRVHHLANALACLAIILDAELYGKLTDDRPPVVDHDAMARLVDESPLTLAHLKDMFRSFNPHQYTINDTRRPSEGRRKSAPQKSRRVQAHARSKRHGRTRS